MFIFHFITISRLFSLFLKQCEICDWKWTKNVCSVHEHKSIFHCSHSIGFIYSNNWKMVRVRISFTRKICFSQHDEVYCFIKEFTIVTECGRKIHQPFVLHVMLARWASRSTATSSNIKSRTLFLSCNAWNSTKRDSMSVDHALVIGIYNIPAGNERAIFIFGSFNSE